MAILGGFERFIQAVDEPCEAQLMHLISSECTSMNLRTQNISNPARLENGVKHGKKGDWDSIQILSFRKKSSRKASSRTTSGRNNLDADYGRLVQGIKNAFAT
jgi:hypothetical protein